MNKDILWQIENYGYYLNDMRNDGFSQFEVKKKLYKILWETQRQLDKSPTFVGEDEWLKENSQPSFFSNCGCTCF